MNKKIIVIIASCVLVVAIACVAIFLPMTNGGEDSSSTVTTTYKVVFDTYGGSSVKTQTVKEGETANEPTPPTKDGHLFDCWVLGGEEYDFSTPITKGITLTARWFNTSNHYRVSTGVDRNIGNRGSAIIVGKNSTHATVTEGTQITLKAQANEGYAFSAWVDNETDTRLSTDIEYTFKVRKNAEIKATFLCVVSGTDNPINKAFLEALENTSMDEGEFNFTQKSVVDDVTNVATFKIAFNRSQGLAQISINMLKQSDEEEKTLNGEIWIEYKDDTYTYYIYDGKTLTPLVVPDQLLGIGEMIFEGDQIDAQKREQAILTIYNMFKDNLTVDGANYGFATDVSEYLTYVKDAINENGNLTVKQVAYKIMKPTWDEVLKMIEESNNVGQLVSMKDMTIEGCIQAVALMSGATDINGLNAVTEGCKQAYLKAIDALEILCEFEGKPMDEQFKQDVIDLFPEIMGMTVEQFLNKLNDGESDGAISDIPKGSTIPYVIVWSCLYNLSVEDTFIAIINALNLNETVWDVTSSSAEPAILNGTFVIENQKIKSYTSKISEKEGRAEIMVEFNSTCSLTLPE